MFTYKTLLLTLIWGFYAVLLNAQEPTDNSENGSNSKPKERAGTETPVGNSNSNPPNAVKLPKKDTLFISKKDRIKFDLSSSWGKKLTLNYRTDYSLSDTVVFNISRTNKFYVTSKKKIQFGNFSSNNFCKKLVFQRTPDGWTCNNVLFVKNEFELKSKVKSGNGNDTTIKLNLSLFDKSVSRTRQIIPNQPPQSSDGVSNRRSLAEKVAGESRVMLMQFDIKAGATYLYEVGIDEYGYAFAEEKKYMKRDLPLVIQFINFNTERLEITALSFGGENYMDNSSKVSLLSPNGVSSIESELNELNKVYPSLNAASEQAKKAQEDVEKAKKEAIFADDIKDGILHKKEAINTALKATKNALEAATGKKGVEDRKLTPLTTQNFLNDVNEEIGQIESAFIKADSALIRIKSANNANDAAKNLISLVSSDLDGALAKANKEAREAGEAVQNAKKLKEVVLNKLKEKINAARDVLGKVEKAQKFANFIEKEKKEIDSLINKIKTSDSLTKSSVFKQATEKARKLSDIIIDPNTQLKSIMVPLDKITVNRVLSDTFRIPEIGDNAFTIARENIDNCWNSLDETFKEIESIYNNDLDTKVKKTLNEAIGNVKAAAKSTDSTAKKLSQVELLAVKRLLEDIKDQFIELQNNSYDMFSEKQSLLNKIQSSLCSIYQPDSVNCKEKHISSLLAGILQSETNRDVVNQLESLKRVIEKIQQLRFDYSLPIPYQVPNTDMVNLSIKYRERKMVGKEWGTEESRFFTYQVKSGLRISASTGIYVTGLVNRSFSVSTEEFKVYKPMLHYNSSGQVMDTVKKWVYTLDNKGNKTDSSRVVVNDSAMSKKIIESNRDNFSVGFGGQLNFLWRTGTDTKAGFMLGAIYNIKGTDLSAGSIAFLPGVTVLTGRQQRVAFSGGLALGPVKTLSNNYNTNSLYPSNQLTQDFTQTVWRTSWFLAITYNLGARQTPTR